MFEFYFSGNAVGSYLHQPKFSSSPLTLKKKKKYRTKEPRARTVLIYQLTGAQY